jgi:glycerol-3-phosphate dehydrogenase (NAD(P)+)
MDNEQTIENTKVGVIGGGSWGTALADLLASKGIPVELWVYEEEVKQQILEHRENRTFLPGFALSDKITPTNDLDHAIRDKDMVLMVVPSHVFREMASRISTGLSAKTIVVSASKGIENKTHLTMSGVLQEALPDHPAGRLAVISGPSFAREVVRKVPTAITVASSDHQTAVFLQQLFATPQMRVYTHADVIGIELGGAVKNVIAIASGIIDGLGLGLNTRAALLTRGLAEIRRLGVALGADPWTFSGLAGVGDLILTATGDLSRNYTVGKKLGQGMTLKEILSEMTMVAEGVKNASSVYNLSRKMGVDMPISQEVYHILYDGVAPQEAVHRLMTRDLRDEMDEDFIQK